MNEQTHADSSAQSEQPKWKPLNRIQRRVLGVLVEKAKTTPDAYPMTLNAITTGCNQKSNRAPLMDLTPDEVETALDTLRSLGAVAEVQGTGRVAKYRHYAYEWLGVDKVEVAVMTELLLRGEQTVGELRGRAARMEAIADLNALRPVLESLMRKGLVVSLTPEGRGQLVTHGLYEPHELKKHVHAHEVAYEDGGDVAPVGRRDESVSRVKAPAESRSTFETAAGERIGELEMELARLSEVVRQLESRVADLEQRMAGG